MVVDTQPAPLLVQERFDLLYSWLPRVRPRVVSLVGSQDAEDVLQQTYLNVWRVLPHTDHVTISWLRTIATNVCLDHLRRLAKTTRNASSASIEDAAEFVEAHAQSSPDVVVCARERLNELFAQLDRDEAVALVLNATVGQTQAAAHLGKSSKAVKTMVYRSREKLKERQAV